MTKLDQKLAKEVKDLKIQLETLRKENKDLKKARDDDEISIKVLKDELETKSRKLKKSQEENRVAHENSVSAKADQLDKEKQKFESKLNQQLNTIKFKESQIAELKKENHNLKKELQTQIHQQNANKRKMTRNFKDTIDVSNSKIRDLEENVVESQEKNRKLKEQLKKNQQKLEARDKIIDETIKMVKKDIQVMHILTESYRSLILDNQKSQQDTTSIVILFNQWKGKIQRKLLSWIKKRSFGWYIEFEETLN